jgi:hypothetical protein
VKHSLEWSNPDVGHVICWFVSMMTHIPLRTWRGTRMQWGMPSMTPSSLSACRQPWRSHTWSSSTNQVCHTRDWRRSRDDEHVVQCGRPCRPESAKSFDVRPFLRCCRTEPLNGALIPSQVFSNSLTRRISIFSTVRWNPWLSSSRMSSFRLRRS